jgi:peptidoglycan/xylan/chitin deacetylase (PgdA/CDA1 family)
MQPTQFENAASDFAVALAQHPPIRAVNFHSTPRTKAAEYRQQLARWSERFCSINEDDLDLYLASGRWHKAKPGLIMALYDGTRNGYDVMLPLLEQCGLIGWYFVVTGFINAPSGEQMNYAAEHDIGVKPEEYPDGRQALSWNELRDIQRRGHVVASHARSHVWLEKLNDQEIESEVLGSQEDCQKNLGRRARTFVSFGGPTYGVFPRSSALIDRAGYQFVFSNLKIQRLRDWVH